MDLEELQRRGAFQFLMDARAHQLAKMYDEDVDDILGRAVIAVAAGFRTYPQLGEYSIETIVRLIPPVGKPEASFRATVTIGKKRYKLHKTVEYPENGYES